MIAIQNLVKTFDRHPAVNGLSFEAPDWAITGLLGANGAGKTTTLRMISAGLTPESGRIIIDDPGAAQDPMSRRRRIGALLDHAGLYSRLSVRENLEYFGQLRGIPRATLRDRIDQLLPALSLDAIATRRAAGLSQGERMKVALGRAILHNPRNLLLDEPTNGLDVPSVRSLREVLRRLRDAGTCIIFSSHVLDEVRALCDNIVIIAAGRLIDQGTPSQICTRTGTSSLEDAFLQLTSATQEQPC